MKNWSGNIHVDPTAVIHPTVVLEGIVTIGAYTRIGAGTVLTDHVTVGHHCNIQCNTVIRGGWIGNYVHIYDCVSLEQGRPGLQAARTTAKIADRLIIEDHAWINHGATLHGAQIGVRAAVGLNACCDYNTRLGEGAVLANGSATRVDQIIPANAFAEGVPARVVKENITDDDPQAYFGLVPAEWTLVDAEWLERHSRERDGSLL